MANSINIERIQQVLTKEVSRKEFLQHLGVFILGFIGFSSLLAHFTKNLDFNPKQSVNSSRRSGYGARTYGE